MREAKPKIINTFIALSKTEHIQKISVNSIVKKAKINRSTFYYYFENMDKLILELEDLLLEEFNRIHQTLFSVLTSGVDESKSKKVDDFFHKNQDLIEIFILKKQGISFYDRMLKLAIKNDIMMAKIDLNEMTIRKKYALQYLVNGQLWLIGYWLKNQREMPIEELIEFSRSIITKGAISEIL